MFDAAILQAAEAAVLGNTPKGAPAALVKFVADLNKQRGVVGHDDMIDVIRHRGVTIAEAEVCGYRMITESIGGQVIGQFGEPVDVNCRSPTVSEQKHSQPPNRTTEDESKKTKLEDVLTVKPPTGVFHGV
ncbi:hypothetical protein ACS0TY_019483 [Phlomoides rotata]